jgi:hypothetical protein
MEEKKQRQKRILTLRSAPARELNRVAVTTLLFLGSTAPTATSGVSTSPTSLGAAVNIAARPNSIPPPALADPGLTGVPGGRGLVPVLERPVLPWATEVDGERERVERERERVGARVSRR